MTASPHILKGDYKKLPKWAAYDGNPTVKKAYVQIEYTPEQVDEIARCAEDLIYFAEHYVYIIDPDKGKTIVQLRDYQKKLLHHFNDNRFSVVLAARQIGKSTIAAIYIVHYLLFNRDKKIAIIANKGAIAKEIFQKVKIAYERLPYWLQVGVIEWQKTACVLENGSACFSEATTEDGIRGITANVLFLDEFAFVRRTIADSFFTSVYPTISASKESKIIIVSTPNGLNHFHDIWQKAIKKKNTFSAFRVDWWEVPGRDEAWKKETIKNIGQTKFNQEYGNQFLGSSYTLIKAQVLEDLESLNPVSYDYEEALSIWEEPKKHHQYVCGTDTAKGTGGEYSVTQVLDITTVPFRQVAMFRSNEIGTRKYAEIVESLARKYNEAYIMCENNDMGQAVIDYLWNDAEYENLVNFDLEKSKDGRPAKDLGIRATRKTKSQLLDIAKLLFEELKVVVYDQNTIYELSKFVEVRPGIFKAEEGEYDDCVMSLFWALFITKVNVLEDTSYIWEKLEPGSGGGSGEDEEYVPENEEPILPVVEGFGVSGPTYYGPN